MRIRYEDKKRESMQNVNLGIYKVALDNSHPLAFGYDNDYYTLKLFSSRVSLLKSDNVGIINSKTDLMNGFVGEYRQKDLENTLVFGVESKGKGNIVYMTDNLLFRAFWHQGKC